MKKKTTANFLGVEDDSSEDKYPKNSITKRLLTVENEEESRKSVRRSRRMSKRVSRSMVESSMIDGDGHNYIPLVD